MKRREDKKKSTTQDPSAWEYIEKKYKKFKGTISYHGSRGCGKDIKGKSYRHQNRVQFNFGTDVETFMLEHISKVVDVIGGGHCEYRSLAELLGWGEKEWIRVRRESVEELDRHRGLYDPICHLDTIDDLREQIDYYISPAPSRHWIHICRTRG
ncbi:unnamed protein product [Cuscuta europaea]|uniref:Uncharacterized protein n=1 Tax=Cuscuta europaea TaxID=41803 RepID=A0A9P1EIZ1_CUSEU|nr:unnamed protein product [Cuscuta europaea]